jgi:lipoate---protein ligase
MRERKVPGGKLLRLKVEDDNGIVVALRIEGDFFLHPEEGLGKLEKALIGVRTKDQAEILTRLDQVIGKNGLQVIGFSAQDVAELLGSM